MIAGWKMVDEKSATLPSSMRRMRLRQLKKILPSDHISIEKNFPRFHQKCQTLKMNRIKSTADINDIDDVQDLRLNTTIGSDQPTLTNQFERVPSSDIHHIKAYKQCNLLLHYTIKIRIFSFLLNFWDLSWEVFAVYRNLCRIVWAFPEFKILRNVSRLVGRCLKFFRECLLVFFFSENSFRRIVWIGTNTMTMHWLTWMIYLDMVDSSEITMADHLEEMTLQRGCWLQATLRNKDNSSTSNNNNNNNNRKTLPAIVYTHRKRNDQQTGRVQLTMEVMEEFRRQKMHLLLQQYSSNDSINNNNTFTRSSYHNTLPIFNRASIHLHTRRVTWWRRWKIL